MAFKRVLVISDLHCGSRVGLTPSDYDQPVLFEHDLKWGLQREEQWNWFSNKVKYLRDDHCFDLLIVVGDCVDGPSNRANGRDVIWPQPEAQVQMATRVIEYIRAKEVVMVDGTTYHVANAERAVANNVNARLEGHAFPIINGVQFDVKHKIGSSSVPHGRHTPLSKAIIWNQLHSEIAEDQPNADIILRGHVHYHIGVSCVAKRRIVHAWTCPALQGLGSEYGDRECEGTVDYGLMHFDINDDGSWSQQTHLLFAESHKAQSTVCCV